MATALGRGEPGGDDTRARIMQAGLAQCEDVGLRRTTMEDIARRAGLARVTLYRHFQNKDALVRAIIVAEAERFFEALDAAIETRRRSDDRLVEGFAFALDYIRGHALFQRLLKTEPETLLPYLIGDSYLIGVARAAAAERIAAEISGLAPIDAQAAAELVVRLVVSLALSPASALGVDDAEGARRLARRYIVPGLPV